jgi:hypothetical protein
MRSKIQEKIQKNHYKAKNCPHKNIVMSSGK